MNSDKNLWERSRALWSRYDDGIPQVTGPISRTPPFASYSYPTATNMPSDFAQGSFRKFRVGTSKFLLFPISDSMDAAFDALLTQAEEGTEKINWTEFSKCVKEYLNVARSSKEMDNFFSNTTLIGTRLLAFRRYEEADDFWSNVLQSVIDAETASAPAIRVHKGSGYYFWGLNAFSRRDEERGLLLMHQAAVEDERHSLVWPDTSAASVVTLNSNLAHDHPARWWVKEQTESIDSALEKFGSQLRIADIQVRCLHAPDQRSNNFLFVHAHASILRLAVIAPEHRNNNFVARLAAGHFFNLAVVVENLIKQRTGSSGQFGALACELSKKLGGVLADPIPGNANGLQHYAALNSMAQADPDTVLRNLLSGKGTYDGQQSIQPLDLPLGIGYVLRNLGGHRSEAPRVVVEEVEQLRVQMLGLLARCIEAFY